MICPPVNSENYKALISKLGPLGAFKVFLSLRKKFENFLTDDQIQGKLESMLAEVLEQDPEPLTTLAEVRAEVNKMWELKNKLEVVAKYNSENAQKIKLVNIAEDVEGMEALYDVEYEVPIEKLFKKVNQIYSQLGNKTKSENVVIDEVNGKKPAVESNTLLGEILKPLANPKYYNDNIDIFVRDFNSKSLKEFRDLVKKGIEIGHFSYSFQEIENNPELLRQSSKPIVAYGTRGNNFLEALEKDNAIGNPWSHLGSGQNENLTKKNLFTVKPIQSTDKKAIVKASIATQYIGFGEGIANSSTESYRQQILEQEKSNIDFQVENSGSTMREMYLNRTAKNASADITIDFGLNQEGESWTKNAVLKNNKKYIGINTNNLTVTNEVVNKIVEQLNSVNAKSLNIAGMGIYNMKSVTQEEVDNYVYKLLNSVLNSSNLKTKIESIRTGGQTGFDESGAKAGQRLGIKTLILAPKGFTFRNKDGKDISNEQQFKDRFKTKLVNSGNYSSNDVIFVSIGGKRPANNLELRKSQQDRTIKEAIKAIEAGATLITDNVNYIHYNSITKQQRPITMSIEEFRKENGLYNEGEKRLYENLKSKGYNYSEQTVDGQILGVWTKNQSTQEIKPGVEELFDSNPEFAAIGTQEQYSQYLDSLNKPNTNPILQNNQQEQAKKFAELQERLSNKEFLEGAKFAYESTPVLKQYGTQEQYNDFIARVSLGIIKNPSSGEYNYTSKVKDIVYHGTDKDNIQFIRNNIEGYFAKVKGGTPNAIFFSKDIAPKDSVYTRKFNVPVILNLEKPFTRDDKGDRNSYPENYKTTINNAEENGYDGVQILNTHDNFDTDVFVVFNPEQIHILGSKQDIEGFENWITENKTVFESALDITPVQSDVLDDFYRNYTFRDTSNDESTSSTNFEKSVEQLTQIQDEYKKLYNQGNVEYAIPLKKIKNLLNEVNSRRQRLPGTKKVTWTSNDIVMLQPLITDLSEVLTKDVISKIKKDSSLLEKYRFRDSSLTSNELSDLEDLVLKYKTYLHEFSQLETLGAIITNNYNDVLKVQGAVNAEMLYKDFLDTFRSFKVYNSLVNDVILIHSLNKEIDTASTSEVADSLTKAKQMVKSLLFEFDSNKLSAYFLNLSESTNPLLQLVSKLITKMKVSRASNFEAFSAKHKEKLDAFKKVTEGVENPTKMFIQKDQDGKYTKYLIDKISYEFKIKLNNLFNKVNFKNAQVDKYQVASYLKLVSNHLTVKSKPFFKRVDANMLNELTSGVISQEEYDTWYRYNSPESLQEAMNLIKAAYIADPNLSPNSLFENQSLIEAGKTIISFEGDMFYTFDMDENNPNNDQYINPQYKELMTKDQAIIDYYNFIVDYTSKFRLMMPPSFESDLFESTSIFEISKTLSEVIQDEGFVGAAALGIEDWALSLVSENSNFQELDIDPVTGKVKLEPKKTDNTGIDIDEMSMDLTKVLNAHAAAAIIYTNALATAKEVNIIKHTLENSTVQEGGEHILKNAINQLEEIALSEIAGKEKKQEGITETKILSSKDKKKLEEYTKELASEEIKGQVLENIVTPLDAAIDIHKQNSYPVSKEASFKEYLQEILTKAKLAGLDLSFLKVNVLLPSTLATNVTLEDISNASDSDISAILNSATANLRLMNALKYLSETVLPQEIRKNESLQKKLNYKIKGRGKFLSWDAMLSSWMSWTRKVGLSFRLSTVTADLVMNFSGAMKEAVAGTYFDVKTLTNAYRIAFKETVSSVVKEDSKLVRFRNKLGLNDNIRKPNEYFTKGLEKYKDKEYALFLNQLVGDVSENAIMIAVLKSQKIKVLDSNNVEVETNIWDGFNDKGEWLYPNSKNPLEFDLAKDNSEYVEFVTSVSGKVKQAVYKITGMSKDAVAYNRDTFARLLMMFKSWLPQAVYSRLGEEKPNLITGKLERGMYRTIFDRNGLLRDEKGNFDAQRFYTNLMYFGSLGYTKGSLREHDLANLRRLRVEATIIALLLGAFYGLSALVSGGGDDDEEISSINRSLLNIINKIYKDASAFYDSESLISTFGVYQVAPIAMLGKVGEALGHVAYTVTGFKGFDGKYNPVYTTGDLKGAYKARRKVVNLIPIASGIQSNIENATMDKTAKRTY